ncbi:MAG: hypothetical protein H7248_00790 [Microbacteriaceae bacterium]|nr:hypothetical protein [Microbacteriaceae bacterium]
MEMLFAVLGGGILGIAVRYALRGRSTHGVFLLPAVAVAAAAVVWDALTWVGWKFDGGWIWTLTLFAAALVALVVGLIVPPARQRSDAQLLNQLGGA